MRQSGKVSHVGLSSRLPCPALRAAGLSFALLNIIVYRGPDYDKMIDCLFTFQYTLKLSESFANVLQCGMSLQAGDHLERN